jgi:hypothetical protein
MFLDGREPVTSAPRRSGAGPAWASAALVIAAHG